MDKSLIELMEEVSVIDASVAVLLVITVAIIVSSQKNKVTKYLEKWRKNKNEEEDFDKMVHALKDEVDELTQNRINDREDSRRIRSEMYDDLNQQTNKLEASIAKLTKNVEELTQIVLDMEKKNSKTKRAEIKEKIERIYRECHPTMTCTDMQLETLKELIEEYEEHGGTNSFVHSTVEPEMYLWNKINRIKPM